MKLDTHSAAETHNRTLAERIAASSDSMKKQALRLAEIECRKKGGTASGISRIRDEQQYA